jgi:Ca-activated chloride channel family protein
MIRVIYSSLIVFCLLAGTSVADDAGDVSYSEGPGKPGSGGLWYRTDEGTYTSSPVLDTDVSMQISGMIARVSVKQTFHNPSTEWAEAIYTFPLPENAAVDHMRMKVGGRIIEGQIKERQQARVIYTKAKQQGKRTSLVEQDRPNIFKTSVANIAPASDIEIEIEYLQTLSYRDKTFSIRFPLVVAPRYIPGRPAVPDESIGGFSAQGWAGATGQVPDAQRITPPVIHPAAGKINPVSITIDLAAGFPLQDIRSSNHAITVSESGNDNKYITLKQGLVPADRDFELVWTPRQGHEPKAALFHESSGNDNYNLLMILPPDDQALANNRQPRDLIFVIDVSGSMGGASIKQARAALLSALDKLHQGDRFNIIWFNHAHGSLYSSLMDASDYHIQLARQFIQRLRAGGGTEMLPALQAALAQAGNMSHNGRLQQIVFITDGAVGNETALFDIIDARLANSRLFTVGIGSAPNSYFMRKAAEAGKGSFTYIGNLNEVQTKMDKLFQRLEYPALTNINLLVDGEIQLENYPDPVPDLYRGEPVVIAIKSSDVLSKIRLEGDYGKSRWTSDISLSGGQQRHGVAGIWARQKIARLMDEYRRAQSDPVKEQHRGRIIDVALQHHLVSRFTSLVAVDVTPVRSDKDLLKTHQMKTNLPAGWDYTKTFGMPQTATSSRLYLYTGFALCLLSIMIALSLFIWPARRLA